MTDSLTVRAAIVVRSLVIVKLALWPSVIGDVPAVIVSTGTGEGFVRTTEALHFEDPRQLRARTRSV